MGKRSSFLPNHTRRRLIQSASSNLPRKHPALSKTFLGHPQWASIKKKGILHIPNEKNWNSELNQSPIIPLVTLPNESTDLAKHMHQFKFWANLVKYPIVPKDLDRVRISIHVDTTKKQIEDVIDVIMERGTCRAKLEVSRL
jgi:8-amino-7-oxononanoate synthase